ncbi:MAG: type I phosphomannose isomerase catalytic subunit [Rikenellaceae bacterium]
MLYPMKFRPILKSAIWGGEKIIPYKGLSLSQEKVGESWELSGVSGQESIIANGEFEGVSIVELLQKHGAELIGQANYQRFGDEFPLLIKFIDARDDLSIQVHPDDELAAKRHNSKGKTEMWYVVDTDKGAKLRSGFSREVSAEEYVQSVEEDCVTDLLQEYQVNKGDLFFLPAGRIHSIGAGCFIAEIQQTSNITYRIYDFNRTDDQGNPRELHTSLAKDAIDYSVEADYRTHYDREAKNQEVKLVACDYFKTSLYDLDCHTTLNLAELESFIILICVEGAAQITCADTTLDLRQGETVLIPASATKLEIATSGAKILTTHI